MITLTVTSLVGRRVNPVTGRPHEHTGTDYAAPQGTPITPVEDGVIRKVWLDDPTNGTAITVDHAPRGLRSSYLHLSALRLPDGSVLDVTMPRDERIRRAPELLGARVWRNQVMAWSGGMPGAWGAGRSTGPHLHLQLLEWDGNSWRVAESLDRIDWTGVNLLSRVTRGARS